MSERAVRILALCVALAAWTTPAWPQNEPEVLFVFDASGSMHQKAGAGTRLAAAKDVMKQIVPNLDPGVRVGLVAYGHRRRGDCADIEVLIPPGSADREALMAAVSGLQAQGMTPITDALSTAIGTLKLRENETTVVLVSDGEETCHADPCAVVKQLKATGIRFVAHVVGFQVDARAAKQLACIAEAGGGRYVQADDAAGLLAALQRIDQEVNRKVEAARAEVKPAGTGLGKIQLDMPEESCRSMAALEIVRASDGKVVKKTDRLGASTTHPLMDGEYEVWYLFAQPNYGEPTRTFLGKVQVRRGATVRIPMGAVAFNVADVIRNDASLDQVIVSDSGSGQPVVVVNDRNNGYYNFLPKALLPGVYDVEFRYGNSPSPATVARRVAVSPGQIAVVTLDSGIRVKPAASTDVTGWDLVPVPPAAPEGGDAGEGAPATPAPALEARPPSGNRSTLWTPYAVPPGTYTLRVHVEGMDEPLPVADNLEIKPGQLVEFDTGL